MYEALLNEARHQGVDVHEKSMSSRIKGLYADGVVWINCRISRASEKTCILAEELGHYYTSSGDITDLTDIRNRKQELRAREWAYRRLVPLEKIVEAYHSGITSRYELAEFLGVTEEFLQAAIDRYREKYGTYTIVDGHVIYFDPLAVTEMFD